MASPGGGGGGMSSGSSSLQQNSSSSEEDGMQQVQVLDERKRKRMLSNRESARRSRMRKQKHLDDLMAQVGNLRKSNNQILNNINLTTQQFLQVEADNSILRAQMSELSNRLQSLNEINNVLGASPPPEHHHTQTHTHTHNHNHNHNQSLGIYGDHNHEFFPIVQGHFGHDYFNSSNNLLMNPWNSAAAATCMNQPIMASADMFDQY